MQFSSHVNASPETDNKRIKWARQTHCWSGSRRGQGQSRWLSLVWHNEDEGRPAMASNKLTPSLLHAN
jgi:hypothetical protein